MGLIDDNMEICSHAYPVPLIQYEEIIHDYKPEIDIENLPDPDNPQRFYYRGQLQQCEAGHTGNIDMDLYNRIMKSLDEISYFKKCTDNVEFLQKYLSEIIKRICTCYWIRDSILYFNLDNMYHNCYSAVNYFINHVRYTNGESIRNYCIWCDIQIYVEQLSLLLYDCLKKHIKESILKRYKEKYGDISLDDYESLTQFIIELYTKSEMNKLFVSKEPGKGLSKTNVTSRMGANINKIPEIEEKINQLEQNIATIIQSTISVNASGNNVTLTIDGKNKITTPNLIGNPGKTPVRGVDYYTDAEKQEIVNRILDELFN